MTSAIIQSRERVRDALLTPDFFIPRAEATRIVLDKRHIALRAGENWVIYQRRNDGWLHRIDQWVGSRHSIVERLANLNIEPTAQAERELADMSERPGFQKDPDEDA